MIQSILGLLCYISHPFITNCWISLLHEQEALPVILRTLHYFYFSVLSHNSLSPGLLQCPLTHLLFLLLLPYRGQSDCLQQNLITPTAQNPLIASHEIENKTQIPCHSNAVLHDGALVCLTKALSSTYLTVDHAPPGWLL